MDAKVKWIGATVLVCALVLAGGWFGLVSPQRHQVSRYDAQAAAQRSEQQQLQLQLAMLENEKRHESAQQAILAKAQDYIPPAPNEPQLIRQLTAAADNAGIDLQSMTPSTPTLDTAASSTGTTSSTTSGSTTGTTTGSTSPLYEIPVTFTLTGDYFNCEQFLANLESLPRALQVTALSVAPGSGASGTTGTSSTSSTATSGGSDLNAVTLTLTARVFMTTTYLSRTAH